MAEKFQNHKLSKSSKTWLREHWDDPYVKLAQKDGYRSRAAYKLLEIQEKDRLVRPGMTVVDLGAAPGSWSQLVAKLVGDRGRVVASDILPMDGLPGVAFIQGDFREETVFDQILAALGGEPADLVISDMAPNISGTGADQPRAIYLCELALDMAVKVLKPGGAFVVKVFQGEGYDAYRKAVQAHFKVVKTRKPQASRPRSPEVYLLAQDFQA
ncbi:MAG: rRNA methyltransferase [Moraxellaceae bacterium]|jgi:23S rRNA (uridine2552-2'-O)-methyltransferase|nr:rRNA methyltransferase [Moraxellaceae bacterium]